MSLVGIPPRSPARRSPRTPCLAGPTCRSCCSSGCCRSPGPRRRTSYFIRSSRRAPRIHLSPHAPCVLRVRAALGAAGLLPRIEFNALSNLAGGYVGANARVGGLRPEQWVFLAMPGFWYVGASVLVLAVGAPLLVRGRLGRPAWYFGATSLIAVILSDTFETPLDWLLYQLLPGFGSLPPHAP